MNYCVAFINDSKQILNTNKSLLVLSIIFLWLFLSIN